MKSYKNNTSKGTGTKTFFFKASVVILCFVIMGFGLKVVVHPERLVRYQLPSVLVHAALMVLWLLLFVVQTVLVQKKHFSLHRILGLLSVVLVISLMVSGLYISINLSQEFNRPELLAFNFYMLLSFVLLYTGGVYAAIKGRLDWHKRLLFIGSLSLLIPAYVRWCDIFNLDKLYPNLTHYVVVVLLPLGYDWMLQKSIHKATILGVAANYIIFGLGTVFLNEVSQSLHLVFE